MLVPTSDFLHLDHVTHLAGGGQTPFLVRAQAALDRFAQAKGRGLAGQRSNDAVHASVAGKVAALLGAEADDIGFPSSVAHGVSLIADGIDWRDGDNVVMERWEFPSLMNPFLAQRRRGVEVRTVTPEPGTMRAPLARFAEAIDAKTRVVAVSHVSYLTGERHDLEAYAALAKKVGALFVVDASHALGSVPVHAPVAFETLLRETTATRLLLVEPACGEAVAIADVAAPAAVTLAIGPEGGWAPAEVEAARAAGWIAVRLGGRILRAESAPAVAVAACQAVWRDA